MAALVPPGVDLCLGQRMMMFRVKPDVDPAYFMWAMNSEAICQQVILYTGGATSPHINIRDIINFSIPQPTLQEQSRIAQFIDRQTARVDRTIKKIADAITQLQEYRSALITNAVTGKIDVRGVGERKEAAE
jgi:type I restriction enzyme S subunit